ncbi:cupin domain-containing protein [Thermoleophilia bacterium SCSIO 60948]|nr:cupin domain-containing protein [Thermoleophilia bacterium SCSIO 60948]
MPAATPGESLKITPHETIRVVSSDERELHLEVTYGPGSKPPPPHSHPTSHEHFEVRRGRLATMIGGVERGYVGGESFDVPHGTPHAMWNPGSEPVLADWRISSPGRAIEWFRAIDRLRREGETGKDGMPPLPVMAALISDYSDVFELRVLPGPLNKVLIGALAPLGRGKARSASASA